MVGNQGGGSRRHLRRRCSRSGRPFLRQLRLFLDLVPQGLSCRLLVVGLRRALLPLQLVIHCFARAFSRVLFRQCPCLAVRLTAPRSRPDGTALSGRLRHSMRLRSIGMSTSLPCLSRSSAETSGVRLLFHNCGQLPQALAIVRCLLARLGSFQGIDNRRQRIRLIGIRFRLYIFLVGFLSSAHWMASSMLPTSCSRTSRP